MNRTIHNILLESCSLLAVCLLMVLAASCTDDIATDLVEATTETYTLTLAIDADAPESRTELTTLPIKTSWEVGDKVTLHQYAEHGDTSHDYEFEVESISGNVATFTYTGTPIARATNFYGTLTYTGPAETQVYPWGTDDPATTDDHVKSWRVQSANGNSDHLSTLDILSANINHIDLTASGVIKMTRSYGVLKVILRGFIYPISQGSVLYISGFDKFTNGTEEAPLGLVLGYWTNHTVTTNNERETLSGTPFLDVSADKDPLTTYAIDDGRTLVAYVPITDEGSRLHKISKNNSLVVTIVDYWSRDTYSWGVKVHNQDITYQNNRTYTLDLTYMEPDIAIESIAYNHSNYWNNKHFGYVRTKNIGAATPTDEGNYYLFGHEERIYPGRHYPCYPDETPFYYCKEESASEATLVSDDISNHTTNKFFCGYSDPVNNRDLLINYSKTSGGTKTDLTKFWGSTLKAEFDMLHNGFDGWELPIHAAKAAFENIGNARNRFYTTEMVNSSGTTATDASQIVGMRMTMDRTGHVLYFPAGGILEPSSFYEKNNVQYIGKDAIAERSTNYGDVVFMQERLQFAEHGGVRDTSPSLMLNSYSLDPSCSIGNGKPSRANAPLYAATTVRPVYHLYLNPPSGNPTAVEIYYKRYPIILYKTTE